MENLEFILKKLKQQGCSDELIMFLRVIYLYIKSNKIKSDIKILRG